MKTHVNRILTKTGLRTRVHAAIYAHEHGLTTEKLMLYGRRDRIRGRKLIRPPPTRIRLA